MYHPYGIPNRTIVIFLPTYRPYGTYEKYSCPLNLIASHLLSLNVNNGCIAVEMFLLLVPLGTICW